MRTNRQPRTKTPRELAARERRRRRAALDRLLTRGRVVLAIYRLSDPEGRAVYCPVREIAAAAGRSETATRAALRALQAEGEIVAFVAGDVLGHPLILLGDHRDTPAYVKNYLSLGCQLDEASRKAYASRLAQTAQTPWPPSVDPKKSRIGIENT
jgi:hypothetical protein